MRTTTTKRRLIQVSTVLAAGALALTGCSQTRQEGDTTTAPPAAQDSVIFGLQAGNVPQWIAPIAPPDKLNTPTHAVNAILWPPLFEYDGTDGEFGWDKKASLASDYAFNEDNTAITITLGDLNWSDGEAVKSRDVEFWFNLAWSDPEKLGGYSEGLMPTNVTKFETVDDKHFTLTFDKAYNQDFMLANQLTLIRPMPQHAWDKTSADGSVGDYDKDQATAGQVVDFLFAQGEDMKTYTTNPLWQVIAGPYKLVSWSDSGEVKLAANDKYSGTDKPGIPNVTLAPFTSNDAEMNAVRAQEVDYGYITSSQLETKAQYEDLGYAVEPWEGWSITYMPYNFANPTMGPIFKQLYVRQGLQSAIDQDTISKVIWQGAATPDYGPVPQHPETDYLSPEQKANPYPFDLAKAEKYFTDNGWTKGQDGFLSCTNAGTSAGQCGEGITAGTLMEIVVTTQNGSQETDNMMAELKSSFEKIGVKTTINAIPLDSVLTEAQKCKTGNDCTWQFVFFGTAGSWYFSAYPNGERVFAKETKWNCGQYDNPEAEALIQELNVSADPKVMQKYSKLLAEDLPVMWMPNPVYQVSVVKTGLDLGGAQDPGGSFYPQRWSWK